MSGPQKTSAGVTDAAHATTQISYCPYLGLYHYRRADGSEYLFDVDKLEIAIINYQKQGDVRQAEFMANLTALARQCPHSIIEIDSELNYKILQLEVRKEEVPGSGDEAPKPVVAAIVEPAGSK